MLHTPNSTAQRPSARAVPVAEFATALLLTALALTAPAQNTPDGADAVALLRERIAQAVAQGPVQIRMTIAYQPRSVTITKVDGDQVTISSPSWTGGPVGWSRFSTPALAECAAAVVEPGDTEALRALLSVWRALGETRKAQELADVLAGAGGDAPAATGAADPAAARVPAAAPSARQATAAPGAVDHRRAASWPTIMNEGLPRGADGRPSARKDTDTICEGIAANYVNDVGIAKDKAVLVALDFDDGKIDYALEDDWCGTDWKKVSRLSTEQPVTGGYCIMHEWKDGDTGGTASRWRLGNPDREDCPAYFIRLYHRFGESWYGEGKVLGMKGFGFVGWAEKCGADVPCDGRNWFTAEMQWVGWGPSSKADAYRGLCIQGHLYSYLPAPEAARGCIGDEIKVTPPRSGQKPYRFSAYTPPYVWLQLGEWYCFEVGLYVNTPGRADGEARFWINGRLESRVGGLRFHDLKNAFRLYATINDYRTQNDGSKAPVQRWIDNLVIARRYIGPIRFDQARLAWLASHGVVVHTGDRRLLDRMRRAHPEPAAPAADGGTRTRERSWTAPVKPAK